MELGGKIEAGAEVNVNRDDDIGSKSPAEQKEGFKDAAGSEGVTNALWKLTMDSIGQIRAGRFDIVPLGEDFEDAALYVPIAGQVVELRRSLFAAANSLGIRRELDIAYHAASTGWKVRGALANQGAAMAQQFGISAAMGPLLQIAAGPIGMASAVGLGLLSILSSNDEDEKRRKAFVDTYVKSLKEGLKRKSLDDMIQDQATLEAGYAQISPVAAQNPAVATLVSASRDAAKNLGAFYSEAKRTMNANEVKALESIANVNRWKAARESILADKDILAAVAGQSDIWRTLNANIETETAKGLYKAVTGTGRIELKVSPVQKSNRSRWIVAGAFGFVTVAGMAATIFGGGRRL